MNWLIGAVLNLAVGWLASRGGALRPSGFWAGVVIGTVIWGSLGAPGWVLFFFFVAGGSVASRWGYAKKKSMGIAHEEGGRRGASEALANTGVAALLALTALVLQDSPGFWLQFAFAGALATALADTTASEIGPLLATRARHPLNLREMPAGSEGAISAAGTLAGLLAAFMMATLAVAGKLLPVSAFWILPLAAGLGSWVESVMGILPLPAGLRRNGVLNFSNTLVGAIVAAALTLTMIMTGI